VELAGGSELGLLDLRMALLRRQCWFAQMVGGWSEGRSVEDKGAPLAFSFGEREETGRRCCDGVVRMVGFCRGKRGNGDDLCLWGK